MILDYFKMAWGNLLHRKTRSYLTMIGIFIGIAAVVSLVSLGNGLKNAINEQLESIGGDKLFITPKGGSVGGSVSEDSAAPLKDSDVRVIKSVRGIKQVAALQMGIARIEFKDTQIVYFAYGMPLDDTRKFVNEVFRIKVLEGRLLQKGEKNKVMVASDFLLKDLFPRKVHPGDKVLVNDVEFEVVGVVETSDRDSGTDRSVMMNADVVKDLFKKGDNVDMIMAQISTGEDVNRVQDDIERSLDRHRNLDDGEEDFQVQTPLQLVEGFNTILNVVQAVLVGIAGISLLVGGIGIMNTMYTSVLERTKEIGIMKAIGAKNSDILSIFLIESGLLGMVGGAIGIFLGFLIGKMVEFIATAALGTALIKADFPLSLILGALAFSFFIGSISGVFPAMQAANMKPVDALRFK